MIFSEKSIEGVLSGNKTCTRRLVKEGHEPVVSRSYDACEIFGVRKLKPNWNKKGNPYTNIYWKGNDYAVCPGRGKKGLWYCPKCKKGTQHNYMPYIPIRCPNSKVDWEPLRVVIKSIRKERLQSISNEDARKEGYKDNNDFIFAFHKINKLKMIDNRICIEDPFVWVLEFEVLK